MDEIDKHLRIASERASTNPEVASANALAAIALLAREYLAGPPQRIMFGADFGRS